LITFDSKEKQMWQVQELSYAYKWRYVYLG